MHIIIIIIITTITFFLALCPLQGASAFQWGPPPPPMPIKQGLIQVTNALTTTPLSIKLDVGITPDSRMTISGMLMELSAKLADDYVHPKMPGADGPHPQLSSGVRTLTVIEEGSFISMMGKNDVKFLNGCWEMVWRENAPAGSLICGFDIPQEYIRNEASLPKGRIYLSFPIWTEIGLQDAQETKESTLSRAKELIQEKDQELEKMQATPNPLKKALHYRNAAAAIQKYDFQDLKRIEIVPSNDEIIALQDDLLLTTKGLVFSTEGSFTQQQGGGGGHHVLLGTAFAGIPVKPTAV